MMRWLSFRKPGWCLILLLLPAMAWAEAADAIVGDWLVESSDAVIRIERNGDGYDGHIVWQLRETYGPEDGPALNGKTVVDRNNPDPLLRTRPLTGIRLLWDLHYEAEQQEWSGGRVYDAEDGHTYGCRMHLLDPDHLKLRGYFGISLIGANSTWTRVKSPPGTPDAHSVKMHGS